ncbi:MAG: bifunctional non-ous end joining protein LigD, partial [Solirubrobacteraceae bacterium]|nr:bifunctional non-ous end joining protein LigD [Solirubrobacteraceae bacterium]
MADRLRSYRSKRDTASTPEPAGAPGDGTGEGESPDRPRFVVQEHSATRLHWDLRLERDGVLVSFAVPNGLPLEPGSNHLAVHTEDHPLEYLEFEGEIPKGNYGAGTMAVWDEGTYDTLKWTDRKIEVHLHGRRVDARYALFPLDKGEAPKDWMIHRMDPPDDPTAEPMPEILVPMLARTGSLPRDDEKWGFEIKWDGVRALCHSEPGRLRLHSRNGNEITRRYPELARLNRALHHHRAILDGEVVAFGADGKPSFAALQRRMHLGDERRARRLADDAPVTYVIFDLLWLDGHPLVEHTYAERRAELRALGLDGPRWQTPDHVVGHGADVLAAAREQGLEGVVAKRLDSVYEPGRRAGAWVKVKLLQREELLICGWLPGEGRRRDRIGALLLGIRELEPAPGLRYAGRVGTGFTQGELDRLADLLRPLEQPAPPFDLPGPKLPPDAVWVRPELVCDVEFHEWTPDGQLRHPSYKGLHDTSLVVRPDRTRKNGALGEIDGREVKLSNLDKVLYPTAGFTKRDVIDYHVAVAPVLLPHLSGRPLTLKRYPNGVEGDYFYEKNAPSHRPDWVRTAKVGGIEYVVVEDVATLVWLANLADLELHTSLARADDMARPTTLAFDLDPGPPAGLLECCRVALWLHGMFDGLGLVS